MVFFVAQISIKKSFFFVAQISIKKNGFFVVVMGKNILRRQGIDFLVLKEDRVDRVNLESRPDYPSLADLVLSL